MGFLIHLEHQAQVRGGLGRRMLEYFVLDWREYNMPVYPIAVLSHAAPGMRNRPPVVMDFPNRRVLEFHFDIVDLGRLDALSYVRKGSAAALALAARMKHDRRRRVELVREFLVGLIALTGTEQDEVADFFFAYQGLTREERLRLNEEVDKLHPAFREEVMQRTNPWIEEGIEIGIRKGIQKGIEQGIEKGIEKGLEKGRRQGEVELVLRQLRRRLGRIDSAHEKSVRNLDLSKVEALSESLLDFRSRKDLSTWLKRHA